MLHWRNVSIIVAILWGPMCLNAQENLRTWHGAIETFEIEAELLDVRDGKVRLKKQDGSDVWIELERLSLADVRFVQESLRKARESLSKQMVTAPTAKGTSSTPFNDASAQHPEERTAEAASSSTTGNPFAGMTESPLSFNFSNYRDLIFPQTPSAWFAFADRDGSTKGFRVANIRTGKTLPAFAVEGHLHAQGLSSDGAVFAAATMHPTKLTLYATATGKKLRDIPLEKLTFPRLVLFPNPNQVLVVAQGEGFSSVGMLFDVKGSKPGRAMEFGRVSGSTKVALSPDGKLLAYARSHSAIHLIDLDSGKTARELVITPTSKSGHAGNVQALSFCKKGAELVALTMSSDFELHAYSMGNDQKVTSLKLNDNPFTLFPHHHSFVGEPIEALSGNQGWLLYGSAIVDPEKGGPVWIEDKNRFGNDQPPIFRALIDDNRQVALIGNRNSARFEIHALPWKQIEEQKAFASQGGNLDDFGLLPIVKFDPDVVPTLPMTANVRRHEGQVKAISGQVTSKRSNIVFDQTLGVATHVQISPKSFDKIAFVASKSGESSKAICLLSLENGELLSRLEASHVNSLIHLSPSGRWAVAASGRRNDRLDIFDLKEGKHISGLRMPHSSSFPTPLNALFLSDALLMTLNAEHKAIVWSIPEMQPLYQFMSHGTPQVFPQSDLFAHYSDSELLIRKTADGQLQGKLASLERKEATKVTLKAIAIRQDESMLAAITSSEGDSRAVVWDLATGARKLEVPLHTTSWSANAIHWCNSTLLAIGYQRAPNQTSQGARWLNQTSIVSIEDKRTRWTHRIPGPVPVEIRPAQEGEIWFQERSNSENILVHVSLPTQLMQAKVLSLPPPQPLIKKGDRIAIEASVQFSGDKLADQLCTDQAREVAKQAFAENGIEISNSAPLKLTIRVEQQNSGFGSPVSRMGTTCTISNITDKVLWKNKRDSAKVTPPGIPFFPHPDARKKEWDSIVVWLKETLKPDNIYSSSSEDGFGASVLSSNGEALVDDTEK